MKAMSMSLIPCFPAALAMTVVFILPMPSSRAQDVALPQLEPGDSLGIDADGQQRLKAIYLSKF